MTLLCPFWTQFWSHFGSQVPNYTPLWGARLRLLCFFGVCFQRRFSSDLRLDSWGTPPRGPPPGTPPGTPPRDALGKGREGASLSTTTSLF